LQLHPFFRSLYFGCQILLKIFFSPKYRYWRIRLISSQLTVSRCLYEGIDVHRYAAAVRLANRKK
jgi:hypothetical protein